MGEILEAQAQQYVDFGREVVSGMPYFMEAIGLGGYLHSDSHLIVALNEQVAAAEAALKEQVSGESHGGVDVDSGKWAIDNRAFIAQVPWMIRSGLWTPQTDIELPSPEDVNPDPRHPIGLDIPDLAKERVVLAEGEGKADSAVLVGALLDGMLRRAEVIEELLKREGSQISEVVILSGGRKLLEREGTSGRYKDLDPTGSERPLLDLFATEYDVAKAIATEKFGGELWHTQLESGDLRELRDEKARYYTVPVDRYGRIVEIFVMNGMPQFERDAVNRPKATAAARAPVTFEEYLDIYGVTSGVFSYVSSYPHRNRIAIEGLRMLIRKGLGDRIRLFPQGLMTFPDKLTAGLHAGEVKPMMDLTRLVVTEAGLNPDLIPRTADAVSQYLQSRP